MKSLLRLIRSNKLINQMVRGSILIGLKKNSKLLNGFANRWRVSGLITVNIHGFLVNMYSDTDDLIVDQLCYGNFDEYSELKIAVELAKRCQYFADIGANTGLYSLLIAKAAKSPTIFAFEPYSINADRLRYNIACNHLSTITIFEYGIGNHDGVTPFFVPRGHTRISQVSSANKYFSFSHKQNDVEEYEEIKIPVLTFDTFVFNQGISKIDFIKIDVESMEVEVLRGSWNSIKNFKPYILCEFFYTEKSQVFVESFLAELDYSMFLILEDGLFRTPTLLRTLKRNYLLVPGIRYEVFIGWNELSKL